MKSSYIQLLFLAACLLGIQFQTRSEFSTVGYKNPTGDKLPLMALCGLDTPDQINDSNFRNLKECGFNLFSTKYGDDQQIISALNAAEKSGIKFMLSCPGVESAQTIGETVEKYKNNNQIVGYTITDEPTANRFHVYRPSRDIALSISPTQIPFITLLPNYVDLDYLGTSSYKEYLRQYMLSLELPLLCFDNYPIVQEKGQTIVREDYFSNLEDAKSVVEEFKIPMWTFILTSSHFNYPVPTLPHLMFEAFTGLAYGSQGLAYYTYGCPPSFHNIEYTQTPIDINGNKSEVWYLVRDLNGILSNLSPVFLGADVLNVYHTGKHIPIGTNKLKTKYLPRVIKSLNSQWTGVVVSHLRNRDKEYLLIVNKDIESQQKIKIGTRKTIARINEDGSVVPFHTQSINLAPGGIVLLSLNHVY